MFQRVIIYLVMLATILCPVNCTVALSRLILPKTSSLPKCNCCSSRLNCDESKPLDDRPIDDLPADRSANCICEGALVSVSLNEVEFEWQACSCVCMFVAGFALPEALLGSLYKMEVDIRNSPVAQSGSFVRISQQSLLI